MVSPVGKNETRQMCAMTESHLVTAEGREPQKQNHNAVFGMWERESGL